MATIVTKKCNRSIDRHRPMSTVRLDNPAEVAWRERITLLAQAEAQAIDEELMQTPGFSIDQLMELAGG